MDENKQITAENPTLAIVSMVLGILSFLSCLMIFLSLPGVICGHMAMARINRGAASGKGFAVAGLVLGYINIALSLISIIALVALFFLPLCLVRS